VRSFFVNLCGETFAPWQNVIVVGFTGLFATDTSGPKMDYDFRIAKEY
jgi:hypothetical protein